MSEIKKTKTIVFITSSEDKLKEVQELLKSRDCEYKLEKIGKLVKVDEPQDSKNIESFVKGKTLNAFKKFKMPVIVEHTILEVPYMNGLPGVITNEVMKKINCDDICKLMKAEKHYRYAVAKTYIGFCDGKKTKVFEGKINGEIAPYPMGDNGFGWDDIFIPKENNRCNETYAEMTPEYKNKISMRTLAVEKLIEHLVEHKIEFYNSSDKNKEKLHEKIEEKEIVLFVGAGVPRNLKLPTWGDLIDELGEMLGYDKDIFNALSNDYLAMADFVNKSDPKGLVEKLIENFSTEGIEKNKDLDIKKSIELSSIYKLITELGVTKVYTTNYDETLEKTFEYNNQKPYVCGLTNKNQKTDEDVEIIKIHGDITELSEEWEISNKCLKEDALDKIIVLTEEGYFRAYDDIATIKKRLGIVTVATESEKIVYKELGKDLIDPNKIFIFIGYGMGDANIRYFLHKIAKKEDSEGENKDKASLFIFNTSPDPIQEKIMENRGILTIKGDNPDHGKALENFLYELKMVIDKKNEPIVLNTKSSVSPARENNIKLHISEGKNINIEIPICSKLT